MDDRTTCSECGANIEAGNFCSNCGTSLTQQDRNTQVFAVVEEFNFGTTEYNFPTATTPKEAWEEFTLGTIAHNDGSHVYYVILYNPNDLMIDPQDYVLSSVAASHLWSVTFVDGAWIIGPDQGETQVGFSGYEWSGIVAEPNFTSPPQSPEVLVYRVFQLTPHGYSVVGNEDGLTPQDTWNRAIALYDMVGLSGHPDPQTSTLFIGGFPATGNNTNKEVTCTRWHNVTEVDGETFIGLDQGLTTIALTALEND